MHLQPVFDQHFRFPKTSGKKNRSCKKETIMYCALYLNSRLKLKIQFGISLISTLRQPWTFRIWRCRTRLPSRSIDFFRVPMTETKKKSSFFFEKTYLSRFFSTICKKVFTSLQHFVLFLQISLTKCSQYYAVKKYEHPKSAFSEFS